MFFIKQGKDYLLTSNKSFFFEKRKHKFDTLQKNGEYDI